MSSYFKGLRTTIYKVTDLNEAKKWYSNAFKTKPYFDEPFYVGFNIAGYELGLQPSDLSAEQKEVHVISYWAVEDIDEAYNELLELGSRPHGNPTNVGGELMVASVIDPWGNPIGIIYNPYFKAEL